MPYFGTLPHVFPCFAIMDEALSFSESQPLQFLNDTNAVNYGAVIVPQELEDAFHIITRCKHLLSAIQKTLLFII